MHQVTNRSENWRMADVCKYIMLSSPLSWISSLMVAPGVVPGEAGSVVLLRIKDKKNIK